MVQKKKTVKAVKAAAAVKAPVAKKDDCACGCHHTIKHIIHDVVIIAIAVGICQLVCCGGCKGKHHDGKGNPRHYEEMAAKRAEMAAQPSDASAKPAGKRVGR